MRKKVPKAEKILLAALNVLCIGLVIAGGLAIRRFSTALPSQQAAQRWVGDETDYSQVSCFLSPAEGFDLQSVWQTRKSIDAKYEEASITAPDGARLWIDGYSSKGELSVQSQRASADLTAFGVGGDFFKFHPMELLSGYYFSSDALMQDGIVLDETAAWQLFGSSDVAGMQVMIGGVPHFVSGVVRMEEDSATKMAYSGGAMVFVSYDTLLKNDPQATITCYETILPNPVSGFAFGVLEGAVSGEEIALVENTTRFSLKNLIDVVFSFPESAMKQDTLALPYWENAAKVNQARAALVLALLALPALVPVVSLAVLLVMLFKRLKAKIGSPKERYEQFTEWRWAKERERKQRKAALSQAQQAKSLPGGQAEDEEPYKEVSHE